MSFRFAALIVLALTGCAGSLPKCDCRWEKRGTVLGFYDDGKPWQSAVDYRETARK